MTRTENTVLIQHKNVQKPAWSKTLRPVQSPNRLLSNIMRCPQRNMGRYLTSSMLLIMIRPLF